MEYHNYLQYLSSPLTPTPYPYDAQAIVRGFDGGDFTVRVLAHRPATGEAADLVWKVRVEFEPGDVRWLGAEAVEFPAPLTA